MLSVLYKSNASQGENGNMKMNNSTRLNRNKIESTQSANLKRHPYRKQLTMESCDFLWLQETQNVWVTS